VPPGLEPLQSPPYARLRLLVRVKDGPEEGTETTEPPYLGFDLILRVHAVKRACCPA
jgi:hypothetical protein